MTGKIRSEFPCEFHCDQSVDTDEQIMGMRLGDLLHTDTKSHTVLPESKNGGIRRKNELVGVRSCELDM